MSKNFREYKRAVDEYLQAYLQKNKKTLGQINHWGADAIERLTGFVSNGKTIRGSLVLFAFEAQGQKVKEDALRCAAAMELFQAGFLIHDDIMDKDDMRRGKPSMYKQYEMLATKSQSTDASHFGLSMGINSGDLCFFLANKLLGELSADHLSQIFPLINEELSAVVVAQMQDVSEGHTARALSKDDLLSVYRHKTARYTFFLPLALGAVLAGANERTISQYQTFGEAVGMLFQISDDKLSASGKPGITGKPIGSDVRNNKQTLASLLTPPEMETLQKELTQKAYKAIADLSIAAPHKSELEALVSFCQNRDT